MVENVDMLKGMKKYRVVDELDLDYYLACANFVEILHLADSKNVAVPEELREIMTEVAVSWLG